MERSEAEIFERKRIAELMNRLLEYKKFTKNERRKIWQIEKELEEKRTVLSEIELISTYLVGYVSQITTEGYTIKDPHAVINHLQSLSIFNGRYIIKWYPFAEEEYPKIKQLFELLDYIRLLLLDFIQRYRIQEVPTN